MRSKRILLKRTRPEDAARIVEAIDVSALQNLAFFSGNRSVTVEDERAYLNKIANDPQELLYLVILGENGKLVGTVGLHDIDAVNRHARLGISIFRLEDRGQGYASEALGRLIEYAFTIFAVDAHHPLHKLYLNVFAQNERAQRRYENLGFRKDGLLRQHYLLNGGWHDMVHMSLLNTEWEQRQRFYTHSPHAAV